MIEVWLQATCNGCGSTHNAGTPNTSKPDYRELLKSVYGWKRMPGDLDYCRNCVTSGRAAKRINIFGTDAENDDSQTD